ncbi:hypothetical protein QP027_00180 [Corynebacterium breve]|uniref:Maltokinase N-terminal cap domain-containing protein n=1 Tax=Corynebacterium breve TaxID=3049799 RepID=A0ABY8VDX6_9CORY|nr:hypothetical protein [Corynebacterium breve]WIM67860.1 hypothetical protein QP027_00180 [Corynebacterium breve]
MFSPSKEELAKRFGAIHDLVGSYTFDDPANQVGIETLVGNDLDGRLMQFPVTYIAEDTHSEATLAEIDHSTLGKRFVVPATASETAVREYIRVILNGTEGTAVAAEEAPAIEVEGSGEGPAEIGEVVLREFTRQRATGTVVVDGKVRSFFLRIPNLLTHSKEIATGHTTSRLRLTGWKAGAPEDTRILAELSWGDLQK